MLRCRDSKKVVGDKPRYSLPDLTKANFALVLALIVPRLVYADMRISKNFDLFLTYVEGSVGAIVMLLFL